MRLRKHGLTADELDSLSKPDLTIKRQGRGIVTDLGQSMPEEDRGRPDGLTREDIEWATELGATSIEEVRDMVRDQKELDA